MTTRKYTKEILEKVVAKCTSLRQVKVALGISVHSGGASNMLNRYIKEYNLDTSHFTQIPPGFKPISYERKTSDEILVKTITPFRQSRRLLFRALTDLGVPYKCTECGLPPTWNGKPLILQIDHIDGDWQNSVKENLRYLCPNCHAQQETSQKSNLPRRCPICKNAVKTRKKILFKRLHKTRRGTKMSKNKNNLAR